MIAQSRQEKYGKTLQRAPVLFIGHGSPMNVLGKNDYTFQLTKMRQLYPQPTAILCISAHWMTHGTWITHMSAPKTIHDFHGFPQPLYEITYPVPGNPSLAELVQQTIQKPQIQLDDKTWGLDHGSWSVLMHIFPEADIPVLQLSLDMTQAAEFHFHLGHQLKFLRSQGVLIVGSGNVVHNLKQINWDTAAPAADWAVEFDKRVKQMLIARDNKGLISEFLDTNAGKLSVPTPDHYYPLLYIAGAADSDDQLVFTYEGMQNASISMRSFAFL